MIALDPFCSFTALLLQLERRLEEVDVEPCRRVEAGHHACRFNADCAEHYPLPDSIRSLITDEFWERQAYISLAPTRFASI